MRIEPPAYLRDITPSGSGRPIIQWVFTRKLTELRHYMRTVQEAFKNKLRSMDEEFERETNGLTDAQKSWYAEHYSGDAFLFEDDFPELMWVTAFLHAYFHLEHSLTSLCEGLGAACKIETKVPRRGGIRSAQSFLKNDAGIDFPFEGAVHGPMWRDIKQMNELRNKLVHAMGHIPDEPDEELKNYIQRQNGSLEIDDLGRIKLKEEFCFEAIDIIERFFLAVLAAVPDNKLY